MRPTRFVLAGLACAIAASSALAGGTDRVQIVSEQDLASRWTPAPGVPVVRVGYPSKVADKSQSVCVSIGYAIDRDGRTSDFSELGAWSSASPKRKPKPEQLDPFVQLAAAAVSKWQFVPVDKRQQTYTSATFAFAGTGETQPQQLLERCRIGDLEKFVTSAQDRKYKRGNMNQEQLRRSTEFDLGTHGEQAAARIANSENQGN